MRLKLLTMNHNDHEMNVVNLYSNRKIITEIVPVKLSLQYYYCRQGDYFIEAQEDVNME